MKTPGFHTSSQSVSAKGFHINFNNGYTLSVQFGYGNYCENRYHHLPPNFCVNAETAIISPSGKFIQYKKDTVQGWQTPNDIIDTIAFINQLPPEDDNDQESKV
jgi:hypothetical protein